MTILIICTSCEGTLIDAEGLPRCSCDWSRVPPAPESVDGPETPARES